jgi:hypothetical protein
MAKKAKRKRSSKAKSSSKLKGSSKAYQDDGGGPLDSEPYHGLLVKISSAVGGEVGGKTFLIRETDLLQYLFAPNDKTAFDATIEASLDEKMRVNVDYAIFAPDFTTQGSAG